jgi:hypothetical protein
MERAIACGVASPVPSWISRWRRDASPNLSVWIRMSARHETHRQGRVRRAISESNAHTLRAVSRRDRVLRFRRSISCNGAGSIEDGFTDNGLCTGANPVVSPDSHIRPELSRCAAQTKPIVIQSKRASLHLPMKSEQQGPHGHGRRD